MGWVPPAPSRPIPCVYPFVDHLQRDPPMRTTRLLALACIALVTPLLASAQTAELKIPAFDDLQPKAVESVNVTIGSLLIGMMGRFMDDATPDDAQLKKTLLGLKSVQVRSFKFNSDYAYPKADIDAVRAQLAGPGWSRLVQVRDSNKKEDVDVYLAMDKHTVTGVAIITSDPRQFTILNVIGHVDINQIAQLQKTFATTAQNTGAWVQAP